MYLDTGNLKEVELGNELGILKGVTTNPTILLKEKQNRTTQIKNLLARVDGEVFVQTIGASAGEIVADATKIVSIDANNRLSIKVPINIEGIKAIRRIKATMPKLTVLGTAIYSAEQAIIAGLAGCDFVAPYVNRMLVNNIDAYKVISEIKNYYIEHKLNCQIMGASFKNSRQVIETFNAGADTATISYEVLTQMLEKELASQAIKVFNQEGFALAKNDPATVLNQG